MRLNLLLESKNSISQNDFKKQFYTDFHGFLSKKISEFCFGNIFPIKNKKIEEGNIYNLIISSHNPKNIEKLFF